MKHAGKSTRRCVCVWVGAPPHFNLHWAAGGGWGKLGVRVQEKAHRKCPPAQTLSFRPDPKAFPSFQTPEETFEGEGISSGQGDPAQA